MRTRRGPVAAALLALVNAVGLSMVLVVALAITDTATVRTAAEAEAMPFGRPLAWVAQDQGDIGRDAFDFPRRSGLLLPQEHPTSLDAGAYWQNVALLAGGLLLLAGLLAAIVVAVVRLRRRGSARPAAS